MTANPSPVECGLAVVHPWLCDVVGHLTTRNYMAMFDDATYQFLAQLGYEPRSAGEEGWAWADVRHEIDYSSELSAGAIVRIDGRVLAVGRSSLAIEFRLMDRSNARLCATLLNRMVCFDLSARRARPLPPAILEAIQTLFGIGPQAKAEPPGATRA